MSNDIITPDLYEIREYVDALKQNHIYDADENSLFTGLYGYIGDVMSKEILNSILVASETIQEAFPINARFDKNILSHAIMAGITNINATPAKMEGLLIISENELLNNMGLSDYIILDKSSKIMIEEFEFHLDYDIRITKSKTTSNEIVYIAQYDMSTTNPLSDIKSPYLSPPVRMKISNDNFIMINCTVRQIELQERYQKIINNDSIQNKTFDFEYDYQMAYFDLYIESSNGNKYNINPVMDGVPIIDTTKLYCYYTHIDNNKIRIKFIPDSFSPSINDSITIRISSTQGSNGNFTYKENVLFNPTSNVYKYNNLSIIFKPNSSSDYGSDTKTVSELKKLIPKEMLSRGSITSETDLDNFFNMLNDKYSKMIFRKEIHNQISLIYYAYILFKNTDLNIVPTNTLDISIPTDSIGDIDYNMRYTINPGEILKYNESDSKCYIISNETMNNTDGFYYTTPFVIAITMKPLSISYYLNILDETYNTEFTYVNNNSFLQFISTSLNLRRKYMEERDTYTLNMSLVQNSNIDSGLGDHTTENLKVFFVFFNNEGKAIRYSTSNIIYFDDELKEYYIESKFKTDDSLTESGEIKISGLYNIGSDSISDVYLSQNTKIVAYVAAKFEKEYGRGDMDLYIPNMKGFTLCNKYTINSINLFINYTEIIKSNVNIYRPDSQLEDTNFLIKSVPLVKYSYIHNEDRMNSFIDSIINRKLYIDDSLSLLEAPLTVDFKFFNTYGPSKTFTIGHDNTPLNTTNVTLEFNLKLDTLSDENIVELIKVEIKNYIENINELTNIHMINMIDYIRSVYPSIIFMEFVGINNYDYKYQYIQRIPNENLFVPEFLNIEYNEDTGESLIKINLV